jgi:hypothetical protein
VGAPDACILETRQRPNRRVTRDGEQPDERPARDGGEAAAVAIRMLAALLKFHPGDVLLCRRANDAPADLHYLVAVGGV